MLGKPSWSTWRSTDSSRNRRPVTFIFSLRSVTKRSMREKNCDRLAKVPLKEKVNGIAEKPAVPTLTAPGGGGADVVVVGHGLAEPDHGGVVLGVAVLGLAVVGERLLRRLQLGLLGRDLAFERRRLLALRREGEEPEGGEGCRGRDDRDQKRLVLGHGVGLRGWSRRGGALPERPASPRGARGRGGPRGG